MMKDNGWDSLLEEVSNFCVEHNIYESYVLSSREMATQGSKAYKFSLFPCWFFQYIDRFITTRDK